MLTISHGSCLQLGRPVHAVRFMPWTLAIHGADESRVIILFSFLIGINEGLCLGSVLVSAVAVTILA